MTHRLVPTTHGSPARTAGLLWRCIWCHEIAHLLVPTTHGSPARTAGLLWRCIWCHDHWRFPPDSYDHCPNGRGRR